MRSISEVSVFLFILIVCFSHCAYSSWTFIGESTDGFKVYVDVERAKCNMGEGSCQALVKFFPSDKERERILRVIREADREAEEQLGRSANHTEKLADAILEAKSTLYVAHAKCKTGELILRDPKQDFLILRYEVGSDPIVRKLYEILCQEKEQKKRAE